MDLLGLSVNHSLYGSGVITDMRKNIMTVDFTNIKKMFVFPDAIPKYLTLSNAIIQKEIESVNAENERIQDKKRLATEEASRYRSLICTMRIPPRSQAAYDFGSEYTEIPLQLDAGRFLSGNMNGEPRVPSNIQPNTAVLLTSCPSGAEAERLIVGAAMANERFWGRECSDGIITLHKQHRLLLDAKNALPFWNYLELTALPKQWGRVPFKYIVNTAAQRILFDITKNISADKAGAANEFYRYFCEINRLNAE